MAWIHLVLLMTILAASSATAGTERLDFDRKAVQRHGPDEPDSWAAMARDRAELSRIWDRYDQRGPLPTIRFKKNVAVLAGIGGSSSCRARLYDVRLDRDRKRIVARMYHEDPGEDGACTDDWVARTFTVAVARSALRPLRPSEMSAGRRRISDPNG